MIMEKPPVPVSVSASVVYELLDETRLMTGSFCEVNYKIVDLKKGTHFILYEVEQDWSDGELLVRVITGEFFGSIMLKPGRYKPLG